MNKQRMEKLMLGNVIILNKKSKSENIKTNPWHCHILTNREGPIL